ncbi:SUKH-3 domain-containing protein [Streptomyces sp. NPDC055893]
MSSWSAEVEDVLEASGWTPGRKVDTARWRSMFASVGLDMHAAAEAFLEEFGGVDGACQRSRDQLCAHAVRAGPRTRLGRRGTVHGVG